jgi:hypothetical protein
MSALSRLTLASSLLAIALASASCNDPVHDDYVSALGGEINGVGPGPRHRPGQPCLVCHDGRGPGKPDFSVAGTVYATRSGTAALEGATVTLQDATGAMHVAKTNDVGNFYITKSEWSPAFPLFVRLESNGKKKIMQTRIGRDADCGYCHSGPRPKGDPLHVPPVFMEDK